MTRSNARHVPYLDRHVCWLIKEDKDFRGRIRQEMALYAALTPEQKKKADALIPGEMDMGGMNKRT